MYATEGEDETRTEALQRENEQLKRSLDEMRTTLDHLRALPDNDVVAYLRQLEPAGFDEFPFPKDLEGLEWYPDPNTTLSYHPMLRAAMAPTQSPLEYELMRQHPHSHPQIIPFQQPVEVANALLTQEARSSVSLPNRQARSQHPLGVFEGPEPADRYCDSRLFQLQIVYWSNVDVTDKFAASVISMYLETDHPLMGMFDAGLFLTDLCGRRLRYCSRLLANAILFYECQAYNIFDSTSSSKSLQFYAEAKVHLQAEKGADSLLTVAALQILSHACGCNGMDDQGRKYMQLCHKMARRMGLHGSAVQKPRPRNAQAPSTLNDDVRFRAHIAWGYFSAATVYAFYYHEVVTAAPLSLPIPGSPGFPLPIYMGSTFPSLCKLWIVVQKIVELYNHPAPVTTRVPLATMESRYQQLLKWADDLPAICARSDENSHHVATMHIWYHTTICYLVRPWMGKSVVLYTFDSGVCGPEAVFKASLRQLKRLALTYRLKYPQAQYHIAWHPALLYVANAVLADSASEPEWRLYFLACLYGYSNLSAAFRLAALCLKGLLTMAIKSRKLSAASARRLLKEMIGVKPDVSLCGLRLDLYTEEKVKAKRNVEELVDKFEETALFDEMTNVGDDGGSGQQESQFHDL